jgi:hypothetical protein
MFQDNLKPLPENPELVPSQIKAKIPHRIPIRDRSTTSEVAKSLHSFYKFSLLPDTYFETLPLLPDDPINLPTNLTHLFPINERSDLKNLSSKIWELKKFFKIPAKLPSSYFNLPPPKIPLPPSPDQLEEEFASFFPLDTTKNEISLIVKKLRTKYFFKRLPFNFFKVKKLLPHDTQTIQQNLLHLEIQIPTTNPTTTKQLIDFLRKDYRFSLPLGPQWVNPEIQQTNKPKLPQNISEIDPKLNIGQTLIKDENLREKIKTLHQNYEFQRIPEHWFNTTLIPLPNNPTIINQILKEKDILISVPLLDNDSFSTNIHKLHQIFSFTKLPELLIIKETLPEPEFDLVPLIY